MGVVVRFLRVAAVAVAFASVVAAVPAADVSASSPPARGDTVSPAGRIAPYQARFGRSRPVVAVVGENGGTELTDYAIPYGVLTRSGVADTFALATRAGPMTMWPTLRLSPQATVAEFDARFPEGADYVIVPAVVNGKDPTLLAWISAQGAKGATVVSICDGALVVADSGLMKGRRATAHWATQSLRAKQYPDTHWVDNARYVADGRVVSSAGISAAIPVSIALVEAIAGRDRAAALAQELGIAEWGTAHSSDAFRPRFGVNLMAYIRTMYTNARLHRTQSIGVPVAAGVDEIALAFTADAYSRTGRSRAYAVSASAGPVRTLGGLNLLPDRVVGSGLSVDHTLPALGTAPAAHALDTALAGIAARYGRSTAYGVSLSFEYPNFKE